MQKRLSLVETGRVFGNLVGKYGLGATVLALPAVASAQSIDLDKLQAVLFPIQPDQPLSLADFFQRVFQLIILIAAVIAILYLIWAGIQYITASTDPDKAKNARVAIYNAIVGIIVIILSYAIIVWVGGLVRTNAPGSPESQVGLPGSTLGGF